MKSVCRAAAVAAVLALVSASVPAFAADDIISTAEKAGSFKTLITAIKQAGLEDTLKGKGPLTVFAPTDDAFKKLPAGALDTLMKPENKAQLAAVLKYHVLKGAYSADRLNKAKAREYTVKTVEGSPVLFNKKDGLTIGGSKVAKADIGASNGTIHVIDAVLLPASVKKTMAKAPAAAPKQDKAPAAAPKTVEPAKPAAEPAKAPATKTEAPKVEAPKAEAPKADAAKAAPAKADAPKADAPKAEAPKAEAPKADTAKPATPAAATQPATPAPAKK